MSGNGLDHSNAVWQSRSWQIRDLPTTSVIGCDLTVLFLIAQILSDCEINLMGGTRLFVSAEVINVLSDTSLSEFPLCGGSLGRNCHPQCSPLVLLPVESLS